MNTTFKKTSVLSMLAVLAAVVVAGCGGGGGDDSSSSTSAATSVVPPDVPVYASVKVRPDQQMADDVNQIAQKLFGVSDLGELIVSEIESDADGDVSYRKDIEPWLGETVAVFGTPGRSDIDPSSLASAGAGDLPGADSFGIAAEVTDEDAAQAFVDEQVESELESPRQASYEGVDYVVGTDGSGDAPTVVGLVDGNLVLASDEAQFKAAVDASGGDSIADSEKFQEVSGDSAEDSLADMYLDVGAILEAEGGRQMEQAAGIYEAFGLDIENAAVMLSLVPGPDQVAVETSTNISPGANVTDASDLIGSFPADSFLALGAGNVGETLVQTLDAIDEQGIPGQLPPNQLKKSLSQSGVDVEEILGSVEQAGFYLRGGAVRDLTGALVITTSDPDSLESSLKTLTTLIGLAGDPSVSTLGGGLTGFAVKVPEFRPDPLVLALKGDRLVLSRGLATARQALNGSGETLSGSDAFTSAQSDLGNNFLTGFVNPDPIASLVASSAEADKDVTDALRKFEYFAFGGSSDGKTGELIARLTE